VIFKVVAGNVMTSLQTSLQTK